MADRPIILPIRVETAIKAVPPEIMFETRQALVDFVKFSQKEIPGTEWRTGELLAFIAGYVSGRANKVIKSN